MESVGSAYKLAKSVYGLYNTYQSARSLYGAMQRWRPRSQPPRSFPAFRRKTTSRKKYGRSFVKSGQKRKKSYGKRSYGVKRLKRTVYSMKRKLSKLPTPAPEMWLDLMKLQYHIPQGAQIYTGLGGFATSNLPAPYNFTSSPNDPMTVLACAINNGSGQTIGASKSIILRWRTEYMMTNIDNSPLEVECLCLMPKKDVPVVRSWEFADTTVSAGHVVPSSVAFTFEYWLSHAARMAMVNAGGNVLHDINTLNPNKSSVPDNSVYTNIPGIRLTDIPMFNEFFKIKSTKRRVLQPGEAYKFVKYQSTPKVCVESKWLDAGDYTAGSQTEKWGQLFLAKKGWKIYVWRFQSIPVAQAGGGTASVTLGDGWLNIVQTTNIKHTYLAMDGARYYLPGLLPTNTTEKSIFPGTSTATANAPAT